MALTRLGNIWVSLRDPYRAATFYEQALDVRRPSATGNPKPISIGNWPSSWRRSTGTIRLSFAQQTASILKEINHPHADWFAKHVEQFRNGKATIGGRQRPECVPN